MMGIGAELRREAGRHDVIMTAHPWTHLSLSIHLFFFTGWIDISQAGQTPCQGYYILVLDIGTICKHLPNGHVLVGW